MRPTLRHQHSKLPRWLCITSRNHSWRSLVLLILSITLPSPSKLRTTMFTYLQVSNDPINIFVGSALGEEIGRQSLLEPSRSLQQSSRKMPRRLNYKDKVQIAITILLKDKRESLSRDGIEKILALLWIRRLLSSRNMGEEDSFRKPLKSQTFHPSLRRSLLAPTNTWYERRESPDNRESPASLGRRYLGKLQYCERATMYDRGSPVQTLQTSRRIFVKDRSTPITSCSFF